MNKIKSILLAAGFGLAIAFTNSFASDDCDWWHKSYTWCMEQSRDFMQMYQNELSLGLASANAWLRTAKDMERDAAVNLNRYRECINKSQSVDATPTPAPSTTYNAPTPTPTPIPQVDCSSFQQNYSYFKEELRNAERSEAERNRGDWADNVAKANARERVSQAKNNLNQAMQNAQRAGCSVY